MGFRGSEKFLKLYAVLFVNTNNLCVCFLEKSSIPLIIISKGSMIPKGLTTTWTGIALCISAIKTLLLNGNCYSLHWGNPFLGIPHQQMRLLCHECLLLPRVVDTVQKNEANSRQLPTEMWHRACTCCGNTQSLERIRKNDWKQSQSWVKKARVFWRCECRPPSDVQFRATLTCTRTHISKSSLKHHLLQQNNWKHPKCLSVEECINCGFFHILWTKLYAVVENEWITTVDINMDKSQKRCGAKWVREYIQYTFI